MAHVAGRQDKSIFITALASTFINCHLLTDVLCDIVVHTMVSVLASCKFLTLIYPSSIERFHMGLVFQIMKQRPFWCSETISTILRELKSLPM